MTETELTGRVSMKFNDRAEACFNIINIFLLPA